MSDTFRALVWCYADNKAVSGFATSISHAGPRGRRCYRVLLDARAGPGRIRVSAFVRTVRQNYFRSNWGCSTARCWRHSSSCCRIAGCLGWGARWSEAQPPPVRNAPPPVWLESESRGLDTALWDRNRAADGRAPRPFLVGVAAARSRAFQDRKLDRDHSISGNPVARGRLRARIRILVRNWGARN